MGSELDELQTDRPPPRSGHRRKITLLAVGVLVLCGCIALRSASSRTLLLNPLGLLQAVAVPQVDTATQDDVKCHSNCFSEKETCIDECESKYPQAEKKQAHMQCGYECGHTWIKCEEVCDEVDVEETAEEVEETEIKTLESEEKTETDEQKAATEQQIQDIQATEEEQEKETDELAKEEPDAVVADVIE